MRIETRVSRRASTKRVMRETIIVCVFSVSCAGLVGMEQGEDGN